MALDNGFDGATFCIHINREYGVLRRSLVRILLTLKKDLNFIFSSDESCLGTQCIYIYKPVLLHEVFFIELEKAFKNEFDLAYSNHQVVKFFPFFKLRKKYLPVWSPMRFWFMNYLGPVIAINSSKLGLKKELSKDELAELTLRAKVENLSKISYVVLGANYESNKELHFDSIKNYLKEFFPKATIQNGSNNQIKISFKSYAPELISIVVPTRGTKDPKKNKILVENLFESICNQNYDQSKFEFVVVYDDDVDLTYLNKLNTTKRDLFVKLVPYTPPFNFSRKSNVGASQSRGEVLIFLNDDTEFISSNAVLELAGTAMLENVGAVGAKLFFANDLIQHAGTVVIGGNLGHAYFKQKDKNGPYGDLTAIHEVSAVTGACLAQRKEIWDYINGWNEEFDNSYNDVDYCFKIRKSGYKIIQNNQVELYHFESVTRDATFSPSAKALIDRNWQSYLADDAFFPDYANTQRIKQKYRSYLKKIFNRLSLG